ncbi:MAG: UDP-glucuronic acid decarboxylase family protein [Candidatus Dormibacteria bacterium]
MRVLVTGGAGFVPSHVCHALLLRGDEVICADNLVTGSRANVELLSQSPRFSFIEQDVSDPFEVPGELGAVLHLASPASPADFRERSIEILRVGTFATCHLLELARRKNARFLLASTSEVYGDPAEHPQREDYWGNVNPIGPRGCYDEAKRCAEAYAMAFHRRHGVETRIARIFNTYGPRMRPDDGRAVPNFMSQALAGGDVTVYGDGSQTRSLCYVDDLVRGLLRLLDSAETRPVNLGSPEEVTMLELAQRIVRLAGTGHIVFEPLPEDDPRQRRPDITRARTLLGWEPEIALDRGLAQTLDWFREAAAHPARGSR